MDRGQTLDVVDTPAKDRRFWPSIEDFQEPERTLRWSEVRQGIHIVLVIHDQGQGNFGPSVVLKIESKDGKTFFVWATQQEVCFCLGDTTRSLFYDFKLH